MDNASETLSRTWERLS
ncbi:hypothetical protein ADUPG1_004101, partial [Aduncisulcus paluster]